MLVGKRPRPQMRRTTSVTGITVELTNQEAESACSDHPNGGVGAGGGSAVAWTAAVAGGYEQRLMMSPRNDVGRKNCGDCRYSLETSHFLRICGLCKRRLAPGRDIYMYKGDTAFCSEECREQQMEHDEANGVVSSPPSN
ncbi:PREDICTED: uncharacterized protein LOC104804160 isoform X2 [Tarenaya hassleriana]|uniref:uncharacterized protein LOC104804160 isoform X1 n=1 Tax=Tarenaya hassleriana TaxID=28532 RepID=UPI00053C789F|nr:PREDICTED: uncharacterized protein LOC104804160 isoform X1 [Tarenaya hassleriana]XP_010526655.1 PREDICTED: uncharacterized protein LOC104804160 isoform X2 [Tarenaya hassleriana]